MKNTKRIKTSKAYSLKMVGLIYLILGMEDVPLQREFYRKQVDAVLLLKTRHPVHTIS